MYCGKSKFVKLMIFIQFSFFVFICGMNEEDSFKKRVDSIKFRALSFKDEENNDLFKQIHDNAFEHSLIKLFDLVDKNDFSKIDQCLGDLKRSLKECIHFKSKYFACEKFIKIKKKHEQNSFKGFAYSEASEDIYKYFETRLILHTDVLSSLDKIDYWWLFIMDRSVDFVDAADEYYLQEIYFKLLCGLIELIIDSRLSIIVEQADLTQFKTTNHKKLDHAIFFIMQCHLTNIFKYLHDKEHDYQSSLIDILKDLIKINSLLAENNVEAAKMYIEFEMGNFLSMRSGISENDIENLYKICKLAELSMDSISKFEQNLLQKKQMKTNSQENQSFFSKFVKMIFK